MALLKLETFSSTLPASVPVPTVIILAICILPTIIYLKLINFTSKNSPKPQGCRKLGLDQTNSNLKDEYAKKYVKGGPSSDQWRVKSLWIYPLKSCKGVELHQADVIPTGLEYDRIFSLAQLRPTSATGQVTSATTSSEDGNIAKWAFLTQRNMPLMTLIKTEIWIPDPTSLTYTPDLKDVQSGGVLIVKFPNPDSSSNMTIFERWKSLLLGQEITFSIPLNPTEEFIRRNQYPIERMRIWKESPMAINMSQHVPEQLRRFLGVKNELGLFRVGSGEEREVFRCAPRKEHLGYQPLVGFADAYPIHIQNLATVRDLGQRIEQELPHLSVLRFRPNIIITGPKPYEEDHWTLIRIGNQVYHLACRTARCLLPNVNPDTAAKHPVQPDRAMRSFRCIDEGAGPKLACLGMQVVPGFQ
ncbi:MAG: Serine active site containing protein 1, partial [Watsoniomyces obsoletus]